MQKGCAMTEPAPRLINVVFDGYLISFDLALPDQRYPCAISLAALDAMSGDQPRQPALVLSAFKAHQARILRVAQRLSRHHPESADGVIRIWESDMEAPEEDEAATL